METGQQGEVGGGAKVIFFEKDARGDRRIIYFAEMFRFHSEQNLDTGGIDDHLDRTDMVHEGHDLLPSSGKDAWPTNDLAIHRLAYSHAKKM